MGEASKQKQRKKAKVEVLDQETEVKVLKKEGISKGYMVSPNYKGKNSMTKTQWRHYQRNKKAEREALISQWKSI